MTNRLSLESSTYLKQHETNPVEWYPWGPEALERAKTEDKPVLLSIGYSACHWCHVMAHECFENESIARLMNEHFVCIKVDREERPDLDHVYMKVAQIFTGGGGWPLTVFLTPDLKPFFGGTYFPPEDRYGRPGFPKILLSLANSFQGEREKVNRRAEEVVRVIREAEQGGRVEGPRLDKNFGTWKRVDGILTETARTLVSYVDPLAGGLGGAPKFPNTMVFTFLWRYAVSSGDAHAQNAVLQTLRSMARGGIYDQLSGGFHRYSVDATWSVPHFEKMLYDNALLLKLYSEVIFSRTWAPEPMASEDIELFSRIIRETIAYLEREMKLPEGGFASAQDADSQDAHGKSEEGAYYIWAPADLEKHLAPEEARVFARTYGVTSEGNFEHGSTVLFRSEGNRLNADESELLKKAAAKLRVIRDQRHPPSRDDKVLCSWNALLVTGYAYASRAFQALGENAASESTFQQARMLFGNIERLMTVSAGRLHSMAGKGNAFLDDYSFLAQAALALAWVRETSDRETWIEKAAEWMKTVVNHFGRDSGAVSSESAGYFFTSDDHEVLIERPFSLFDQAIPNGTSVAISNLQALIEWRPEKYSMSFEKEWEKQIQGLLGELLRSPSGSGELACAAWAAARGWVVVKTGFPEESIDVGKEAQPKSESLFSHPLVFVESASGGDSSATRARAQICHRKTCKDIMTSELKKEIQAALSC